MANCGCNSERCKHRKMVHFHLHTDYSALDGASKSDSYIKRAKEWGHEAITILDHGNMSGTFEFYQKCKASGIKPILGMEAYLSPNLGQKDENDNRYEGKDTHQSIIIKNEIGFKNLNKLTYLSFTEGYFRRGRISTEWLLENKEGLIVTTSCMASLFARLLEEGKRDEAEERIKMFKREFGDDFYAELQFNEIPQQKIYNKFILNMIKKYDLQPILTGDVHYSEKEDNKLQDVLISINQHKSIYDDKAFKLEARHLYYSNFADFHDMNKEFGYNYPESYVDLCLDNTNKLAEKCNFNFETNVEKYPKYEPTKEVSSFFKTEDTKEIITKLSHAKLTQKLNTYKKNGIIKINDEVEKAYRDRLDFEIKVIEDKKMLDYFMVIWELIKFCEANDIATGPGRGCFVPNSRVKMSDGFYAPIEIIKIGELVIDAFGKEQKVLDRLEYDIDEEIIELEFENNIIIKCTKDHEFLTKNRGWVKAIDLDENDDICEIDKKENTKITNKKNISYKGKVYDLTIENSHSYNIESISVHNSAAGSLLSWCLGIVKIDPMRFSLYFERFLNPERKGPPDIDIDFEMGSDEKTLNFLYEKYGKNRVIPVITFGTFNEKGCIKDVAKALGEDAGFESDVFAVTKEMPDKWDMSLKEWIDFWPQQPECSERVRNWILNPDNKQTIDLTLKLQGQVRNIGKHAAGIVITPSAVWNYMPVNICKGQVVSAYQESGSGKDLSTLGILKLDRLKLETLNVIKDAIKLVKENKGIDIQDKIDHVDLEDKNLYEELLLGNNKGIFQFESPAMNNLLKEIKVENFEEVIAANSLNRPGPLGIGAHTEYTKNKFHPEERTYVNDILKPLLEETKGVLIYQETLMFIAAKLAGMSLGEGDNLRKYMDSASKIITKKVAGEKLSEEEENNKNFKEYNKLWDKFIAGCKSSGLSEKEVSEIEEWLIKYLGYSFNKCLTKNHTVISKERGEINLLDVKINEEILTYNSKIQKNEFNKVKEIHKNGIKKIYKIKTKSGKILECTLDHKIMTELGMKTLDEILEQKIKIKINNV